MFCQQLALIVQMFFVVVPFANKKKTVLIFDEDLKLFFREDLFYRIRNESDLAR